MMIKNIIITVLILLFQTNIIYGCECDYASIEKEYITSDFVAIVTVTEIFDIDTSSYKIRIKISELFKGNSIETITVFSSHFNINYKTDCDINIKQGESWLLFAKRDNKYLGVFSCSNSKKIDKINDNNLKKELLILREPNIINQKVFFNTSELDSIPIINLKYNREYKIDDLKKSKIRIFVKLSVSYNGKVINSEIIKSDGNQILDKKALELSKTIEFVRPGIVNDVFVNTFFIFPITFINNTVEID